MTALSVVACLALLAAAAVVYRDAADRACAALEREVEELRQQLAQADADNAGLIQRLRRLQSAADGR